MEIETEAASGFDDLSLPKLCERRSEKWTTYPPDVLPAFVAEMDFALAEPIQRALIEAITRGDTGYASPMGLAEAFAGFAHARFNWLVHPERVFLVPDVMVGVAEVLRLTTEPGSGIVINTPGYPPFFPTIPEYGRRVVEAPLARSSRGWELDFDGLEQAFKSGARAYLLCNPHNPTGRVFSRGDLKRIATLAARYGVVVVSDENHAPLTLAGAVHTPFVSLGEEAAGNAATVISAAKGWNLAGLKCAVVVAGSEAIRGRLLTLPTEVRSRAGHLGVLAAIAAYRDGGPWLRGLLAHLDRNRTLLGQLLAEHLPAVSYVPPEASYLAWLDCTKLGLGDDPAARFLERGRVALSRGLDFGPNGAEFVRLNMGTSRGLLQEAVARMAEAVG
ncbi:MAG TPA: aminotransferase class I/II-fold pyridoxal phosphate-dependent enzyme [Chloroflexota bacterium]|nr:aminotransferase class I/II-fold pyridoxal phosphate-dependent enzyme [Chloroflexota bacterium]